MPEFVVFAGEEFEITEKVGLMPLMRYAHLAREGADSISADGLAAMYDLLESCLAPHEWDRFQRHATAVRADDEDLLGLVKTVIGVLSERPTRRPSDSSDGSQATQPSSEEDSASRLVREMEHSGRPDLARVILLAQAG